MKLTSKTILAALGLFIGLSLLTLSAAPWPAAAQTFNIKQGIVGNLSAACQDRGDCTMCDFVNLFVVLQKVILSLFAGLALIMLIWGGQGMILAAGNQEKFTAGRKLITSTLFGVLIILAAYFLVAILYGLLATPADEKKLKPILTESWWKNELGCKSPSDADFCKDNADGTPCSYEVTSGICEGGVCKEQITCQGDFFACQAASAACANGWRDDLTCKNSADKCCIKYTCYSKPNENALICYDGTTCPPGPDGPPSPKTNLTCPGAKICCETPAN